MYVKWLYNEFRTRCRFSIFRWGLSKHWLRVRWSSRISGTLISRYRDMLIVYCIFLAEISSITSRRKISLLVSSWGWRQDVFVVVSLSEHFGECSAYPQTLYVSTRPMSVASCCSNSPIEVSCVHPEFLLLLVECCSWIWLRLEFWGIPRSLDYASIANMFIHVFDYRMVMLGLRRRRRTRGLFHCFW